MRKLVLAILISAVMAYFASGSVALQFCWGCEAISQIFALPSSFWDLTLSTISIEIFDIAFVASGLFFGFATAYFKGPHYWRYFAILSYLLVLSVYGSTFVPWSLSGIQRTAMSIHSEFANGWSTSMIVTAVIYLALKACLFFGVVIGSEFVFTSLRLRNRPMLILLPGFLAIVFPVLMSYFVAFDFETAFLLNFSCIVVASAVAVYSCRFQEFSRSVCVVFFTTIPYAVLNITVLACACTANNQVLLPSVLSALLLTTATLVASICGATVGSISIKLRRPDPILVESNVKKDIVVTAN